MSDKNKNKRKAIDLETKIKIINQFECGKIVSDLSRELKLSHSTVSTIIKDKKRILEAVKKSISIKSTIITKQRNGLIHEMEKCLKIWMEDLLQKNVPLNFITIQTKARSLFEDLKKMNGDNCNQSFNASSGWFERFKRRESYHNVKICGEAASADVKAAEAFKDSFEAMIGKEEYSQEQIFNVDETALFWKRMPERTYIHQEAKCMPGFKAFKDRLTLLLGGNVAGYKLKPLLIYNSKNPRAFKGTDKSTLPLHYRWNKKAWMTQYLFQDWFDKCFIPEVKKYCEEKEIDFKILLIIDNAPGHPPHLVESHPNIKVIYLPPNTTSILQPMDQGGIANFKLHYLRITFAQAIEAIEKGQTLREFWKNYNIFQAIKNISEGWSHVTTSCMNGIWNKLLKRNTNMYFNRENETGEVTNIIVQFAQKLNLEVDSEDIIQLLENDVEELTNQDLIEIEEERATEKKLKESKELNEHNELPKKFVLKDITAAFSQINNGIQQFENMDPDTDRFSKVHRQIQQALACYNEIYKEKKKQSIQTNLDMFVRKTNSIATTTETPMDISTDDENTTE